jgi:hypothetical protein
MAPMIQQINSQMFGRSGAPDARQRVPAFVETIVLLFAVLDRVVLFLKVLLPSTRG